MPLPTAVTLPAAKIAPAPAEVVDITLAPEPEGEGNKKAKPDTAIDRMSDRIGAAFRAEARGEDPQAAADAARTKTPAVVASDKEKKGTAAAEAAADAITADTDDTALEQHITASTKRMGAEERKAFTAKSYENRELKRKLKEYEPAANRVKELETELATRPKAGETADPKLTEELEQLRARDQEREKSYAVYNVERTDAFKNLVTQPREDLIARVRATAKKAGVDEEKLVLAFLASPDNRDDLLEDATSTLSRGAQNTIYAAVYALDDIDGKAKAMRENAAEALKRIEAGRTQQTEAQRTQMIQDRARAHTTGWAELQKQVPLLTPAEGTDADTLAWNEGLTNAEKFAREADFTSLDIPTQSAVLQQAAVYPQLIGAIASLQAELVAKDKLLGKYQKSTPPAGGRVHQDNNQRPDPAAGETDWAKRIDAKIRAGTGE